MRVLVSGSSGFIGRHLVRELIKTDAVTKLVGVSRRASVYPYDLTPDRGPGEPLFTEVNCDLTQDISVMTLMKRYRPDVVFHLAGVATVKEGNDPTLVTRANVLSTHNLLAHCPEGCRFVLASSATVYGDQAGPLYEYSDVAPTSVYGATKASAEALVQAYTALGRVSGLVLRYAATVGAGATHGLVPDVFRKLRSDSTHLELLGDPPGSVKPYTHVSDVVAGTVHFGFERGLKWYLNLANDDAVSVEKVASQVMKTMGVYKPVRFLGAAANWKGDNPAVLLSNGAARRLGWSPIFPTSLEAVDRAVQDILQRGA